MAILKAIKLRGGGTLLINTDGKRCYKPTKEYWEFRERHLKPRQFRGKSETDICDENCFKLLAAIFGYPMEEYKKSPFKTTLLPTEASVSVRIWRDDA
jgi:hypothetical protein